MYEAFYLFQKTSNAGRVLELHHIPGLGQRLRHFHLHVRHLFQGEKILHIQNTSSRTTHFEPPLVRELRGFMEIQP